MAYARDEYTATASQTDFTITYPFLSRDHVTVYSVGVLQTVTTDYTFLSDTSIRLVTGATAGDLILIIRSTSRSTRSVDFTAGTLTEADLDNSALQMFYLAQEALDLAADSMTLNTAGKWDGDTRVINDVVDPVVPQDAATKAYVDSVAISAVAPSVDALIYNPAGAGAVATTFKAKLDERVTPANFGLSTVNTPFGKGGVRLLAPYTKPTTGVVADYHYAFGSVIESGTTWTLVYRRGTEHGTEDGTQLRVANSLDLGESWINDRLLYTKTTFTIVLDVASVVTNGETLTQATSGATGVVDSVTGTLSTVEMTGVVGTWDKANSYAVTASVSSPSTLAGTVNDLTPYLDIRPDPLSAMASGRIGFFANRQDTGSYDTSPLFWYSDDDGVTWASTVEATTPPYTFAAVGGILPWPASSGGHDTLGFISYGFLSAGDMDAFTTVDNGVTWANSMNVGAASGAITILSENITVRIGTSDRWLIYSRAQDGGGWHDELSVFATTDLLNWGAPLDAGVNNFGTPPGGFYDADTDKVFVIGSSRRGREIDGYTNHMLMVGEDAETLWTNNGVFTESFGVLAAMPSWATGYTHAFETRHGWCLATTAGENQTNGSPPSSMWLIGDFDTKGVEMSEFIEKYTRYMNHVNGLEISAVDNVTTNTPFVVGNNAESATTSMGGYEKNVLLGGGNYTDDYSGMATYVYDNDADDSTHFMRGTGTHEYTYTGPVVINFNDTVKWDTDNHWFGGITANIGGGSAALHIGTQGSTFPALRTNIFSSSSRKHAVFHNSNGEVGSISTSGTATAFTTSSDETMKTFQGNYPGADALAIIDQDPVRSFTWIQSGESAIGWGAQTSYAVSADLASPGGWFLDDVEVTENTEGAEYVPWGIDQGKRTPYLWAAVTELSKLVKELQAKVAELETS